MAYRLQILLLASVSLVEAVADQLRNVDQSHNAAPIVHSM